MFKRLLRIAGIAVACLLAFVLLLLFIPVGETVAPITPRFVWLAVPFVMLTGFAIYGFVSAEVGHAEHAAAVGHVRGAQLR